jgi:hypothetical protein
VKCELCLHYAFDFFVGDSVANFDSSILKIVRT